MYDGMMFALDRRDEGFDAEWGRRGTQRGGATISISHRHSCVGFVQKIIIIFLQSGERIKKREKGCVEVEGKKWGSCASI